jgi:hypothetical protein
MSLWHRFGRTGYAQSQMTVRLPTFESLPDVADFGFDLNNREIASLFWIGVIVFAILLWKQGRDSLGHVVKALFAPALSKIWLLMTAYTAASVWLLSALNAWEWDNLKTTLLWWATVGFASMWESQKISGDEHAFRRLVSETISITVVITFIAEVESFPLWGELILFPALAFLGLCLAISQQRQQTKILVGPFTSILIVLGLMMVANSVMGIITDPADFFRWKTAREFADPILLSILFLPFLYGLAIWMTHESIFTRVKGLGLDAPNKGYARIRALIAFGTDLEATRRFSRMLRSEGISGKAEIGDAIRRVKALKAREAEPPVVAASDGWSPYDAMAWLNDHSIRTNDWHASAFDDEWTAAAYSVGLTDRAMSDDVSYYIVGTEFAATRLRLALNASVTNDAGRSDFAYFAMARILLHRVFGEAQAGRLIADLIASDEYAETIDGIRIEAENRRLGVDRIFGHQRNIWIVHPAHVGAVR